MPETSVIISPSVFTLFDAFSLLSNMVSLVLSLLAIWLTLHFKADADKVNQKTTDVLIDIRSDAKAITQYAMPELRAYGEFTRDFIGRNILLTAPQVSPITAPDLRISGSGIEETTPK